MVPVIIGVPSNIGCIALSNTTPEIICCSRRISVESIGSFFMTALTFPVVDVLHYKHEIKSFTIPSVKE